MLLCSLSSREWVRFVVCVSVLSFYRKPVRLAYLHILAISSVTALRHEGLNALKHVISGLGVGATCGEEHGKEADIRRRAVDCAW